MNFIIKLFVMFFLTYHTNKYLYRLILYFLGFSIDNFDIKNLSSRFIIISTHTSIYDFCVGILIYYGYLHKDYDNYILMKKSYEKFTTPFIGILDKKLKLIEVCEGKNGLTKKIIEEIQYKDNYVLYLSPEGTRKYVENIKSGYWLIAKELNLDVCYIGIDFYKKKITFEKSRKVEEYWDDEIETFKKSAEKYSPLFPENCFYYNKNKIM